MSIVATLRNVVIKATTYGPEGRGLNNPRPDLLKVVDIGNGRQRLVPKSTDVTISEITPDRFVMLRGVTPLGFVRIERGIRRDKARWDSFGESY